MEEALNGALAWGLQSCSGESGLMGKTEPCSGVSSLKREALKSKV